MSGATAGRDATTGRDAAEAPAARTAPGGRSAGSRPPALTRLAGLARLTHPFPSAVDGAVVGAIAFLDGVPVPGVAALAASMFLLQCTIGIGNDLADVERDRGRPDKPLSAGAVSRAGALRLGSIAALLGLGLAATRGPATLGVALLGLLIGLAYDLRLRGTPWSWLPFALGIPLLPLFAWLGGSGCVPPAALLLLPLAVVAGTQLAIANALADLEADRRTGVASVATAMGATNAWRAAATLEGAIVVAAWLGLVTFGGRGAGLAVAVVAAGVLAASIVLSAGPSPARRQLGWALDCVGLGLLAAGWVAALVGSVALPVPPC